MNTISTMRNIFAKASIDESFDTEFGIYDLNEFLAVVSSLNKPTLSLQDKFMTISVLKVVGQKQNIFILIHQF